MAEDCSGNSVEKEAKVKEEEESEEEKAGFVAADVEPFLALHLVDNLAMNESQKKGKRGFKERVD
jgi:hypothetical protein